MNKVPDNITLQELVRKAAQALARAGMHHRIDIYRNVEIDDPAVRMMLGRGHRVRVRVKITAASLLFEGDEPGDKAGDQPAALPSAAAAATAPVANGSDYPTLNSAHTWSGATLPAADEAAGAGGSRYAEALRAALLANDADR